MKRKEETGRPVEDVGCPVGGAEASAEAVKVKKKRIVFAPFKYPARLINSAFLLFIVNIG